MSKYKLNKNRFHSLAFEDVPFEIIADAMQTNKFEIIKCGDIDDKEYPDEYAISWDGFKKFIKPYDICKRSDGESSIFYMYWFDRKKSH